jgi:hypothetical protein
MRIHIEPRDARAASWHAVPAERGGQTGLRLQAQERSRWCWAAIAVSLASHFNLAGPAGAPWTQRGLAEHLLEPDARGAGEARTDPLDREALLETALRRVGCFSHWSPGRPGLDRIAAEIGAGLPVCLRIGWHDGGSHYVVAAGLDPVTGELFVDDPLHGASIHAYDRFPGHYRGRGGVWAETLWIRPPRTDGVTPRHEPPAPAR